MTAYGRTRAITLLAYSATAFQSSGRGVQCNIQKHHMRCGYEFGASQKFSRELPLNTSGRLTTAFFLAIPLMWPPQLGIRFRGNQICDAMVSWMNIMNSHCQHTRLPVQTMNVLPIT
jgi:hypothetical protein